MDSVAVDDNFDPNGRTILAQVYSRYRHRRTSVLAVPTRAAGTPWAAVYAGGMGKGRDISHRAVRRQFAEIAAKPAD